MENNNKKILSYKDAGVDINAVNQFIEEIKNKIKETYSDLIISDIGSFGAMINFKKISKKYKNPVLVQTIDGVGTKMEIAVAMNKFDTIGGDLINHCCNDILVQGAQPLFLLDYLASDKINLQNFKDIIFGMCEAAKGAGVSIIGGETAEMPGIYKNNKIDLVGAMSGIVEKEKIINGKKIKPGDVILGLSSSGFHTNGYSLLRKILFEINHYKLDEKIDGWRRVIGEELLIPHKNYVPYVAPLLKRFKIKGMVHITGGGFTDNIPRILPENINAEIVINSWQIPSIFTAIHKLGNIEKNEMYRIFNMGIGLIMVVSPVDKGGIMKQLKKFDDLEVYEIGRIIQGEKKVIYKEKITEGKTKIIWTAENSEIVLIENKDDITAGDGLKHDILKNKGAFSNQTTCNCFKLLKRKNILTHFIKKRDETSFFAEKVDMIPIEIVIRRVATGSYLKRNPNISENAVFKDLIIELFYKDNNRHDPIIFWDKTKNKWALFNAKMPINKDFSNVIDWLNGIKTLSGKIITADEIEKLYKIAESVFLIIEEAWMKQNIMLVDLKIECGFSNFITEKLVVADVIDNDSWRIWPFKNKESMLDKQIYRNEKNITPKFLNTLSKKYALVAKKTEKFLK